MDRNQVMTKLLSLPGSEECFPFGPETTVYKLKGKMFALLGFRNGKDFINLKAKPEDVLFFTEEYESITPGYHMNKKHWITLELNHAESLNLLEERIDASYSLVKGGLSKKLRAQLG